MSLLSDLVAGLRQVMTMEHRIDQLTKQVANLERREEDTRERLVRLETVIDEARRRGAARRLPEA